MLLVEAVSQLTRKTRVISLCLGLAALSLIATAAEASDWKAGVAKADITPDKPMWMSGYASRDHRAEATRTKLWGKVLVLEDGRGERVVAITLDLVGIDLATSNALRAKIEKEHGFDRSRIALLCSHTHCGPVVGSNLLSMYLLSDEDQQLITEYAATLIDELVVAVGQAKSDLAPAELSWGNGHTDFAVNRRTNKEAEVPALRAAGQLLGPSDHDVPVLKVKCGDSLKALVFGYACHSTTLSFFEWCGDYPGYAMIDVEEKNPGTLAMFWAGCGADQNPLPRRTVELAQEYGNKLATAVQTAVSESTQPITGNLDVRYEEPEIGFDKMLTKERIEANLTSSDRYEVGRAKLLKKEIETTGQLRPSYAYPVQTWKLGDGPLWVILGGEVVVDYAIRLKTEIRMQTGVKPVWVAGYANDVMAYIPSLRVLKEGGYEGEYAMLYYGRPGIWAQNVEEIIVGKVHEQVQSMLGSKAPTK
jgi:neutral ceramidase